MESYEEEKQIRQNAFAVEKVIDRKTVFWSKFFVARNKKLGRNNL